MGNGHHEASMESSGRFTRREALKALGVAGLGMALLSACGQQAAAPAPPADSKPAAPGVAPAAPAASKPGEAAKPPAGAPKDGGSFRLYLAPENPPTLDPYLNISVRV